jgi:hypothetical protein
MSINNNEHIRKPVYSLVKRKPREAMGHILQCRSTFSRAFHAWALSFFFCKGPVARESGDGCCGGTLIDAANCSSMEPEGNLLQGMPLPQCSEHYASSHFFPPPIYRCHQYFATDALIGRGEYNTCLHRIQQLFDCYLLAFKEK